MANELKLLDSPFNKEVNFDIEAVAGLTQVYFDVERRDAEVTSVTDTGGNIGVVVDRDVTADISDGDIAFVDLISVSDPNNFVRQTTTVFLVTSTGMLLNINIPPYNILDAIGFINFQPLGKAIVRVEFDTKDVGKLPIPFTIYNIPFNHPDFAFDIAAYLNSIFVQFLEMTAIEVIAKITATVNNVAMLGSAIASHDIALFKCYLPNGYLYGQNLIGIVLETEITGIFAQDMQDSYFWDNNPPLLFVMNYQAGINITFRAIFRDVNNNTIATREEVISLVPLGIIELTNSIDWQAPVNTDNIAFNIFTGDGLSRLAKNMVYKLRCKTKDAIKVEWVNRLGGRDFFWFDKYRVENTNTVGITYQNTDLKELADIQNNKFIFGRQKETTFKLSASLLSQGAYTDLSKIKQAEFIWIYLGEKKISCILTNNIPTNYSRENQVNYDLEINLKIPNEINEKAWL